MSAYRPAGRRARITLATVARDAGVSTATVSLILNGRSGWIEQFHPETVQRVRTSAEKLGYHRNMFASGLPSGECRFFSLVLREAGADMQSWQCWTFQGDMLEGVNAAAERYGVHPIVSTMQSGASDAAKVPAIVEGGVFGAIFRTPAARVQDLIQARLGRGQGTVVVFPERVSEWPTNAIDLDNLAAGRLAGQLLAVAGRRQWLLVSYERMSEPHRLRCEGFIQLAKETGVRLTMVSLPLHGDENGAARLLIPRLERSTYDALYAVDLASSIGAVLGCLRAGLTPGSECAIVGCDASQWRMPGLPRITSVDVSWRLVGVLAVEQLLRLLKGRGRFKTVLLKPRVVEADTCAVPSRFRPQGIRCCSATQHVSGLEH